MKQPLPALRGGVVLLHGHGRMGASMALIARAARKAGAATLTPSYPYRRSLAEIVDFLAPRVAAFAGGIGGPVHFVTHSLGGLVVRALLARMRPAEMGRAVMLAPPNGGSELADLLIGWRIDRAFLGRAGAHLRTARRPMEEALLGRVDYELGIIAGDRALMPVVSRWLLPLPNDGKVSVAATRLEAMADHVVLPVTHTLMVYDRRVIEQALGFLAAGRFAPVKGV